MNDEIMSRLNAHAQDWGMLPPGFGSLGQQDIAMALGFVHGSGPRLLGRVRYAQQDIFAKPLAELLAKKLKLWGRNSKWKNLGPIPRLAEAAVECYCAPKRCGSCKGIGQRVWANRVIVCPACGGSTWRVYRPYEMASYIGVDDANWARTWAARLGVALDILAGWDRRCLAGFDRSLRNSGA